MRVTTTISAAVMALSPCVGLADQADYTYLEGNYILTGNADANVNVPGFGNASGDEDYDGWNLNGSLGLTPNIFLQIDYSELSADNDNGDLDLLSGGIGGNLAVGTKANPTDIYGVVTYESIEEDNTDLEADGFGITAGMRWRAHPDIEINPYVSYLDYGEIDDTDTNLDGYRFGVDGIFGVNDLFAITAGYRATKLNLDDPSGVSADLDLENEFHVGVRLYLTSVQ